MPKFRRRERDSAAVGRQQAPTPFEVHVTAEGDCSVAGMPVLATQHEALHDAVLNYLHRLAMATGNGVHATVHDARSGYTVPIEVQLDGSSRLTGQPEYAPPRDPETADTPSPTPDPTPEGLPAPTGEVVPPQAPEASPFRKTPAPLAEPTPRSPAAEAPPPAPAPTPPQSGQPTGRRPAAPGAEYERPTHPASAPQQQIPPAFADAVNRINEALAMGHIEFAAATAQSTLDSVARESGPEHPHVLQLQELCAHIAYLAGDPTRSMAISLGVSRARLQQDGVGAYDALLRAAAVWPTIRDPRQGLEHGHQLVALWEEFVRTDSRASAEGDKLTAAKQRVERLTHRAATSRADPTTPAAPAPEEPHP